jgi:ERCC4-related helicase
MSRRRSTTAIVPSPFIAQPALFHVDALMGDTPLLAKEHQDKVLALFRRGFSNTLFTTSVAEEGLDVQHCSLVICYDVPNRPLSLVQTVGRARANNARVVFMEPVTAAGAVQTVRMLCLALLVPAWKGVSGILVSW